MARERKGTLQFYKGSWRARVTVDKPDGGTERLWFDLATDDKALAGRKLAKLVKELAANRSILDAARKVAAPDSVDEYAQAFFEKREQRGVASINNERSVYRVHIAPHVGKLAMADVRPMHIRQILDAMLAQGLAHGSLVKTRDIAHRLFRDAWNQELIDQNPVARVQVPPTREVVKRRAILTDGEFYIFMAHPAPSIRIKLLSFVSRTLGGMRAGDLAKWDWTMIDRDSFAFAFIPRSKTGTPQQLEVPEPLRPFLKGWWEQHNCPATGLVFPVRIVPGARRPLANLAVQLRHALLKAGITRHELHHETDTTLPVDFHSWRRAYNTALAAAGINVQQAMHLAGHSDAKVHMKYVMGTPEMQRLPPAAIPPVPIVNSSFVCGKDDCRQLAHETPMILDDYAPASRQHFAPVLAQNPDENGDPHPRIDGVAPTQNQGVADQSSSIVLGNGALEAALTAAAQAGQWDIVRLLSEELQARRLAAAGVVPIDAARRKR